MRKSAVFALAIASLAGTSAAASTPQDLGNGLAYRLCAMSDVSRTLSVTLDQAERQVYESNANVAGTYNDGLGQYGFAKQSETVAQCTRRVKAHVRICRDGIVEKDGAKLTLTTWSSC